MSVMAFAAATQTHAVIQIDESAKAVLPKLKVIYMTVMDSDNSGSSQACVKAAQDFLNEQCVSGKEKWSSTEPSKIETIALWKKRHKQMGSPSKATCSIESLIRRVKGGKFPRSISPFVDFYNGISLKYELPFGGEDLSKIVPLGSYILVVKAAKGDEAYLELGKSSSDAVEFPKIDELIYADAEGTVCRALNWRESARTMLDKNSRNAIFVTEVMEKKEELRGMDAMLELGQLITRHCGGNFNIGVAE